MPQFRIRLKEQMERKSRAVGFPISQSDVSRGTGLSYPTIQRVYKRQLGKVDAGTIWALMTFFNCSAGELIEVSNGHADTRVREGEPSP